MSKYQGFQSVKLTKPKRSHFDLSHFKRTSTRAGRLTPVLITEAVPGDSFNGSTEVLLRLAPLLAPIYDNLQLYVHFFFVPNRILWEEWEEFITGGRLGVGVDPVTAPVPPYFNLAEAMAVEDNYLDRSSLADYLGLPVFKDLEGFAPIDYTDIPCDLLPFLAYGRVWYDYYRDRNFVADTVMEFPVASGEHDPTTTPWLNTRTRCWEHDYFTSALPFTQRGTEVLMPLAGSGTVSYLDNSQIRNSVSGSLETGDGFLGNNEDLPGLDISINDTFAGFSGDGVRVENIDEVLLNSSDVSVNDLRTAIALQVWLERNAVAGSRYTESTQAHFGVRPQDSRLQRAEYIGGGRISVKISEVVSTAYSNDGEATVPLANMAGHGITYGNTNSFRYFCPEHGFIIGIASIMSPGSYHQGMPRMFRRRSFLDYPWPTFAKLGEQQIDKAELWASAGNLTEDENGVLPLFGYTSRYADWKNMQNTNHGLFHDDLLFWTLTRDFTSSPELGAGFTEYTGSVQDRIFAVNGNQDNFWLYVHNNLHVKRCLPYFGTPNTFGFS